MAIPTSVQDSARSLMTPSALTHFLTQVRLFQGLAENELQDVAERVRPCRVEQGHFFFRQEDPATTLYVLNQGKLRLTQLTPDGQQVLLRFFLPGEMLGAVAALSESTYPASAQAVEDCLALAWAGPTIAQLMERYPRLALNALHLLTGRIRELQDSYRELATERVERRVARAVLRLVRQVGRKIERGVLLDLPLSRQSLAEMTGTNLYQVSRILSQWEQRGLIEAGRERILIRFPHGLVAVAEDLPPAPLSPEL